MKFNMSITDNTIHNSDSDSEVFHWSRPKSRTKKFLLIAIGLSLLGISVATAYFYSRPRAPKLAPNTTKVVDNEWDAPYTTSRQELANREVTRLKDNPPAVGSDSSTTTEYYSELLFNQRDAGKYKDMLDTYDSYIRLLDGKKPGVNILVVIAEAYSSLGDKKKAQQLLDEAETTSKQTISNSTDLELALDSIRRFREELK